MTKMITLEYDESTATLIDKNGMPTAAVHGLVGFEPKAENKTKELVSLKDAGFTADEIMQMKREGLI